MDRDEKMFVIGMILFIILISSMGSFGFIASYNRSIERDNNLIGEGTVTGKDIERVEDFPGTSTFYLITLDYHTEYEIDEDWYYAVNVGDSVEVYESGRVEVLE